MREPRLLIFDVDGTIVDSRGHILAAMHQAFAAEGLAPPPAPAVLATTGLSLPEVFEALLPDAAQELRARLVARYREAFLALREGRPAAETAPLFPGMRRLLERLAAEPWTLLALATGKSRRGVAAVLEGHGLTGLFHSVQTADEHPSKPHPAMVEAALDEAGVGAERALVIGDTCWDMEMARHAGVRAIAVAWGHGEAAALRAAGAADVAVDVRALEGLLLETEART